MTNSAPRDLCGPRWKSVKMTEILERLQTSSGKRSETLRLNSHICEIHSLDRYSRSVLNRSTARASGIRGG